MRSVEYSRLEMEPCLALPITSSSRVNCSMANRIYWLSSSPGVGGLVLYESLCRAVGGTVWDSGGESRLTFSAAGRTVRGRLGNVISDSACLLAMGECALDGGVSY
jgi:hypothetical protein